MVILCIERKTETANSQTDDQSNNQCGRNLMSASKSQTLPLSVKNLEIENHRKERCPPVLSPLTMTSGETRIEQPKKSDGQWKSFVGHGCSSAVRWWMNNCINHHGYRTNQPKLAAPKKYSSVSFFSFLVLEVPGLLCTIPLRGLF